MGLSFQNAAIKQKPPNPQHKYLVTTRSSSAGVTSYNVSLETQTADVTTNDKVSYDTVLEKIKKTGKTVVSGEADGVTMAIA